MAKKLIVFVIAAIMTLCIFGLTACTESLAEYKVIKSQALQDYADAKGEENYCTDSWEIVCKAVSDGKTAINAAENKDAVDKVYKTATNAVDAVQRDDTMSDFELTISVDKSTKNQGENFVVEVSLKNQSGGVLHYRTVLKFTKSMI